MELINSLGLVLRKGVALDFGCGIGRITQPLAEEFETCFGVDISEKMIEVATQYNQLGDRCIYIANSATDLKIFDGNMFDFVFSTNALQHNPPEIIRSYLPEFVRIFKPAGILMFQIPIKRIIAEEKASYLRSLPKFHPKRIGNKLMATFIGHSVEGRYYRLRKLGFSKKWLNEKLGLRPHIGMYLIEEEELRELLKSHGCTIKHLEKYEYKDMTHANFVAVKSG